MTRGDVGLSAQANGDGILFFRKYEQNGELRDMKPISKYSHGETPIDSLLMPLLPRRWETSSTSHCGYRIVF